MERGEAYDAEDVKTGTGAEALCRFEELPEQCLAAKGNKRVPNSRGPYPLNGKYMFISKKVNFGRRIKLGLVRSTNQPFQKHNHRSTHDGWPGLPEKEHLSVMIEAHMTHETHTRIPTTPPIYNHDSFPRDNIPPQLNKKKILEQTTTHTAFLDAGAPETDA